MPIEDQLKTLQKEMAEIKERFLLHSHSGIDSQAIDFKRIKNSPITSNRVITGNQGSVERLACDGCDGGDAGEG